MSVAVESAVPTSSSCTEQTLAELERIVRESDAVLRNLLITHTYHQLSAGLSRTVNAQNVNWCTFATWASKTAGRSIRNEEVPRYFLECIGLDGQLRESVSRPSFRLLAFTGLEPRVRAAALAVLREVSEQVADGNRKVFEELAPLFARYRDLDRAADRSAALARFLDGELRPGSTEAGGQDLLRQAFSSYEQARAAVDPKECAELMLLANCRIGLHEQTRLQPNIRAAMDAPISLLFIKHLRRALPAPIGWFVGPVVGLWLRPFLKRLQSEWERIATRYAMNLALPSGQEIPLGNDLPERPAWYPPDLAQISHLDLREILTRFDSNLNTTAGSGANNWAELQDRMGFIVELFRSRQQDSLLLGAPFTPAQVADLQQGRVPTGPL